MSVRNMLAVAAVFVVVAVPAKEKDDVLAAVGTLKKDIVDKP